MLLKFVENLADPLEAKDLIHSNGCLNHHLAFNGAISYFKLLEVQAT